ncbi:MAG: SDR family NAD(P)-dependent oxidoreductase, partial [Bacillota bacterium]
ITKLQDIKNAVEIVIKKEGKIDLLVNNAGMGISGSVENTLRKSAKYIFDVNVFGPFELAKEIVPYMRKAGHGKIINISSLAAIIYLPFQGFYSSTKAALNMLFNSMQLELKPYNISITNIMPGDIKTEFTSNRQKNPKDDEVYKNRIEKSLAVMEKGEQNGMPPQAVANCVLKVAKASKPKLNIVVGLKYKVLVCIIKILPASLVERIIYLIYGG